MLLACAIAAGVLLRRILRRRRGAVLPADYAKALRLLSRRGLVRTPQQTAADFLAAVAAAHPGAAEVAFGRLTQSYLAQRFGGRPATPSEHGHDLRILQEALKRRGTGGRRGISLDASAQAALACRSRGSEADWTP